MGASTIRQPHSAKALRLAYSWTDHGPTSVLTRRSGNHRDTCSIQARVLLELVRMVTCQRFAPVLVIEPLAGGYPGGPDLSVGNWCTLLRIITGVDRSRQRRPGVLHLGGSSRGRGLADPQSTSWPVGLMPTTQPVPGLATGRNERLAAHCDGDSGRARRSGLRTSATPPAG